MAKKKDMQALQDMNNTLNKKNSGLKENIDSLTDTLTELRNEIKALKDPLAPKNWWQALLYKNITGRGILYCIALLAVYFLLYKGNIKLSDLTEAVNSIKK